MKKLQSFTGILGLVAFIGVFIGAFGFMEYFEENDMLWVELVLFGLTFFFFGITAIIGTRQAFPLLFIFVGAGIAGISMAYGFGDEALKIQLMSHIVPMTGLILFPTAGCGLTISGIMRIKRIKETFTEQVQAEIIRKQRQTWYDSDHDHHTSYVLTWRYYAHGEWHEWKSNGGRSPEPREIGDYNMIFINPENPGEAYDEKACRSAAFILIIMGLCFILFGSAGLILFFMG